MRHRLSGLCTYGLNGLDREMSTPPIRSGGARPALPFLATRLLSCKLAKASYPKVNYSYLLLYGLYTHEVIHCNSKEAQI